MFPGSHRWSCRFFILRPFDSSGYEDANANRIAFTGRPPITDFQPVAWSFDVLHLGWDPHAKAVDDHESRNDDIPFDDETNNVYFSNQSGARGDTLMQGRKTNMHEDDLGHGAVKATTNCIRSFSTELSCNIDNLFRHGRRCVVMCMLGCE